MDGVYQTDRSQPGGLLKEKSSNDCHCQTVTEQHQHSRGTYFFTGH
jgi:hypothetical protein